MQQKDELAALRAQILSDITPLVLEGSSDGSDRFAVLLRLIQAGDATASLYHQAYDSVKKFEDPSERLNASLALLDELEVDIDEASATDAPEDAVESQPSEQQNNQYNEAN